jgi:hypothetical protein
VEDATALILTLVGLLYSSDRNGSNSLLIDELAEARLALDDTIRNVAPGGLKLFSYSANGVAAESNLLAAESGQPHNKLDRIDIVSDDNLK